MNVKIMVFIIKVFACRNCISRSLIFPKLCHTLSSTIWFMSHIQSHGDSPSDCQSPSESFVHQKSNSTRWSDAETKQSMSSFSYLACCPFLMVAAAFPDLRRLWRDRPRGTPAYPSTTTDSWLASTRANRETGKKSFVSVHHTPLTCPVKSAKCPEMATVFFILSVFACSMPTMGRIGIWIADWTSCTIIPASFELRLSIVWDKSDSDWCC